MSTRKTEFALDEYYHIYNRGVEKRTIFLNHRDYSRFMYCLFVFNDRYSEFNLARVLMRKDAQTAIDSRVRERHCLVDIICFCLMPNHIHLMLRQRIEGGISLFMQKLGTAYTMYFNKKYERTGALFEGTFKSVHISEDRHFLHVTRYIHLNPLSLVEKNWKQRGVKNWGRAREFLATYPWSSYRDYIGETGFPLVIQNREIIGQFTSLAAYQKFVESWAVKDLASIQSLVAGVFEV